MKKIDAILDGMYLAESMLDYSCACATTSPQDSNTLQQSLYSTTLLPIVLIELAAFTAYAVLAKCSSSQTPNLFARSWPYFRDFISGLKNGRHAVINLSFLMQHCAQQSLYQFANPIGISVGALLALNLVWYRRMNLARINAITHNTTLLEEITDSSIIKRHSLLQRSVNFISAGFDGLTDGMYLCGFLFLLIGMGLSGISAGLPLIIAAVTISLISLISFVTKIHDEYLAQQKLEESALRCEIALLKKQGGLEQKISEKERKLETMHTAVNPTDLSFLGKLVFFTFRGLLSGIKNAQAAITHMKNTLHLWVISLVVRIVKLISAIGYAIYLGLKSIKTEFKKNKLPSLEQCLFSPPKTIAPTPPAYLRNDYA